ncbi:MAG: ECF-type sigma factor [Pseudomonadota bacterium]
MNLDEDLTQLLHAWMEGDVASRDKLFGLTYEPMRKIAANLLRHDRQRQGMQPTELVNECAIRMFGLKQMDWQDRAHFAALAATMMRRILVDEARRQRAGKRDGQEITLATSHLTDGEETLSVLAVDAALSELATISPPLAQVVEVKFFAGLTNHEVGTALGISEATVKRHWRAARAWLVDALR